MVTVADPPALTDDGLKLAVTPDGNPLADNRSWHPDPAVKAVRLRSVPGWACQ